MCKALLEEFRVAPAMYQVGRTKLFFRAGVLGHLEDTWARIQRSAATKLTDCPMTAGACRRLEGQVHALHCCSAQVYTCSLTIACSVLSRQTQAAMLQHMHVHQSAPQSSPLTSEAASDLDACSSLRMLSCCFPAVPC